MTKSRGLIAPKRRWQQEEIDLLRQRFADTPTAVLAAELDRKYESVSQMAGKLGLKKSAAYMEADRALRSAAALTDPRVRAAQFKPGLKPWNTGTKGLAGQHENSRATQFKKGRPPQEARNYKPIGSYRINGDGHLERKMTDDPALVPARRWTPVYRLVWEAAYGPIPAGHRIDFKPGMRTTNPDEITADKLECIDRVEHMRRHTYHQYGPEVAHVVQLRGAISRQINKRKKEISES